MTEQNHKSNAIRQHLIDKLELAMEMYTPFADAVREAQEFAQENAQHIVFDLPCKEGRKPFQCYHVLQDLNTLCEGTKQDYNPANDWESTKFVASALQEMIEQDIPPASEVREDIR